MWNGGAECAFDAMWQVSKNDANIYIYISSGFTDGVAFTWRGEEGLLLMWAAIYSVEDCGCAHESGYANVRVQEILVCGEGGLSL